MKKLIWMIPALLLICFLVGCGSETKSPYTVYAVNRDTTELVPIGMTPTSNELNTSGLVEELLAKIAETSESQEYQSALYGKVSISQFAIQHTTVYLYLSEEYAALNSSAQLLCRAALVKTLVQVDGIDAVYFYVGGKPLTDSKGVVVGVLTADSFVSNPGSQINYTDTTTFTLYFTDEKGKTLIPEVQTVHYISSISMEKLVVEQLISGPETEGLKRTVPESTKVLSVSLVDGTCYVNFNEEFLDQNLNVSESVVIYSIVDSLFALNNGIGRVMISVNGDSSMVYREKVSLDQFFTKNLDLIDDASSDMREAEVKLTSE